MRLSIAGLQERKAWELAGVMLPDYNVAEVAEKTRKEPHWLHFGAGNIFRIFIGGLADELIRKGAMQTGIVCAETFDYEVIDRIYEPFDNLVLAVTMYADGTLKKRVLGSLAEAIVADSGREREWNRLREIFVRDSLQMVSFTITEKGYVLKDSEGRYLPWIWNNLEGGTEHPASVMTVVCSLLWKRYQAGAAPIALVSMDNCSHNGEKLQQAIETIADEWEKRGFVSADFVAYVKDRRRVSFPWTMIDKITPRPSEQVYDALSALGICDMKPIVTEKNTYIAPFVNAEEAQYLVIEDDFPNGRPPLEQAGVYLTDRETVDQVERMKVTTCLNPLHTALAVYGCLLGYTQISEEMQDPLLRELVRRIGLDEGMPVVTDPKILSPKAFADEVIRVRFPNPYLPDAPQRIATDTSQKVGIRYGETIRAYVQREGNAKKLVAIPLAIAGWFRYLLAVDDAGNAFDLSPDPMLRELTETLAGIVVGKPENYRGQLKQLLANEMIFGSNLYEARIGEQIEIMFVKMIAGKGAVKETLKEYLKGIEG